MNFETWEPVYEAICADMGYDRHADEAARDEFASLVEGKASTPPSPDTFDGEIVALAAPGPTLSVEDVRFGAADTVVAAGVASDRLLEAGMAVDWIVTDLDGHAERVPEFTTAEIPVVIHAHGDNRELVASTVPACERGLVLPTTQAEPRGPVRNFGGFTDGDRAAFFADAHGAATLRFPGWDLEDETVGPDKRRKLQWAARLLAWLERRRDERFAVLDGLRDDLDLSVVPDA